MMSLASVLVSVEAFIQREQYEANLRYAATCDLSPEERVQRGVALGPLRVLEWSNRLGRLSCAEDLSKFQEGQPVRVGPPAIGASGVRAGLLAEFLRFDQKAREVEISFENDSAWVPPEDDLFLDEELFDMSSAYLRACRIVLTEPLRPLIESIVFGTPAQVAGAKFEHLTRIARALKLDRSQAEAFTSIAADPIALIQGPPGTGKTTVLASLVAALVAEGRSVLICTIAHRAVNHALTKVAAGSIEAPVVKLGRDHQANGLGERVLRIGSARELANFLRERPVSVTGTVVARVPALLDRGLQFDTLIVDEAGQLTIPALLSCAGMADRAIVIGDHRQLPPIFSARHPDSETWLTISAFEHLLDAHPASMLRRSYRLNAELAAFPSAMWYDGRLVASRSGASRRLGIEIDLNNPLSVLLDPGFPLVWARVDSAFSRPPIEVEASLAAELVGNAIEGGLPAGEIAVISPYRAQNRAIRDVIRSRLGESADELVVDTVERLQGQEREVVIVSLGASDPEFIRMQQDFLFTPNRLNVAITRARSKSILIGSPRVCNVESHDISILRGATMFRRLEAYSRVVDVTRAADDTWSCSLKADPVAGPVSTAT